MSSGQVDANAARNTLLSRPLPQIRIASGISATDGIGRRNSTTARTERYSSELEPMKIPAGIAIAAATSSPSAQPCSVSATAVQNVLLAASSASAANISVGGGKCRLE